MEDTPNPFDLCEYPPISHVCDDRERVLYVMCLQSDDQTNFCGAHLPDFPTAVVHLEKVHNLVFDAKRDYCTDHELFFHSRQSAVEHYLTHLEELDQRMGAEPTSNDSWLETQVFDKVKLIRRAVLERMIEGEDAPSRDDDDDEADDLEAQLSKATSDDTRPPSPDGDVSGVGRT